MNRVSTPYIYALFFLFQISLINAQQFKLTLLTKSPNNQTYIEPFQTTKLFLDTVAVFNYLDSTKTQLQQQGFAHTIYNTSYNKQNLTADFTLGNKIENALIDISKFKNYLPPNLLSKVNQQQLHLAFTNITSTLNSITTYLESQGHALAKISLNHISFNKQTMLATLNIEHLNPRKLDKIIVRGYKKFPEKFIKHHLGLEEGTIINNDLLQTIDHQLNLLQFAKSSKAPEVLFTPDSTILYMYLDKQKANRFDGLIGFNSKEQGSGIEFNGYLDLELNNIFNAGESMALLWKSNGNDSQRFFLASTVPYIFNSAFSIDANFEIYRQDSTFTNTKFIGQVGYHLKRKHLIAGKIESESSSNLLDLPQSNIQAFDKLLFGASYTFNIPSAINLFDSKFKINASTLFGNRTSNQIESNQAKYSLIAQYLFNLNVKNFIFIQNQSAWLNSNDYLENELFRIGGVHNLRGFNEESIYTSLHSIVNLEYRFKPNQQSYFYSITDFAYIENSLASLNNQLYSLGLGYAFQTKLGLFNLSYALGKQSDTDLDFDNSRIHVKVLSFF